MLPLSEETKMTLEDEDRIEPTFASAVTRMVGPITQVLYIFSCAENEGSAKVHAHSQWMSSIHRAYEVFIPSSDSVAKKPAVITTMSSLVIFRDSRYFTSVLLASGVAISIEGM
jgi:hypothetical protein